MTKRIWSVLMVAAAALSACGTVQGNAPAGAGTSDAAVPTAFDAIHPDPGIVSDPLGGVRGGADAVNGDASMPMLMP